MLETIVSQRPWSNLAEWRIWGNISLGKKSKNAS